MFKCKHFKAPFYAHVFLFATLITCFFLFAGGNFNIQWDTLKIPYEELVDIKAIAASDGYSLALKSDGSIIGWGFNNCSQASPPAGSDYIAIDAGSSYALALKADGEIVDWGANYDYWLPPSISDFIAVAAGGSHGLALKSDGSVIGWGFDTSGQASPPTGNDYVAIAAGLHHSLALKKDGSVVEWGGISNDRELPPSDKDYIAIAASRDYSLALKANGTFIRWGDGLYEKGAFPEGNNYVAIAGQMHYTFALKSDGEIVGLEESNSSQASVPERNDYIAISASGSHCLALKSDGTFVGWGSDVYGQVTGVYGRLEIFFDKIKIDQWGTLSFCMIRGLYIFTFCIGPAVIGFLSGRYLNFILRYLFVFMVIGTGYIYCVISEHFFVSHFIPGNIIFVIMCILGLYSSHISMKKKIAIYEYIDSALILLATAVSFAFYTAPML